MKPNVLRMLAAGLLLSLGLVSRANSQTATPPPVSNSVCVPKYQLDGVMADLEELDELRATRDSAHRATLVLTGQKAQLTLDNTALRTQNQTQQQTIRQQRGQGLRETVRVIGATSLKIGAVATGLWLAIRLF